MKLAWPGRAPLRTRVLAGVLLVTLAALAAFDIAAVTALRTYLTGQTDSQLRQVIGLYRLVDALTQGTGFRHVKINPPPHQYGGPEPNFSLVPRKAAAAIPRQAVVQAPFLQPFSVITVYGRTVRGLSPSISLGGVVAIGNAGLRVSQLPIGHQLATLAVSGQAWTATSLSGNQPLRLMAAPNPSQGIIVAMTSLDGVDKTVGRLQLILVIGSAAAGLLAAGGVAWVMRRGLRPIETMAGQADAITAGDLTTRVSPHDRRTEVGRLGAALNGMLARIENFIAEREAGQEATRQFFADASHELRTPLASLRANAELYQQGAIGEPEQVDEAMRRITAEAKRMSALVDDMLRLARLDQRPQRRSEPVDLTALIRDSADRARAADPRRPWRVTVAEGLEVTGDEDLLYRAVGNLLANVQAHTPEGTAAAITAGAHGGVVSVQVSDDGPGVPAGQLHRIFERFYRGGAPSSRPGSGLGLAIVAAVAAAHEGRAEAALNVPHGLRVTLTLPAHKPVPGPPPACPTALAAAPGRSALPATR